MRILFVSTSVLPVPPVTYGGLEQLIYDIATWVADEHPKDEVEMVAPIGSFLPENISYIPSVILPEEQDRDDLALSCYLESWNEYDVIFDFSHKKLLGQIVPEAHTINVCHHPCIVRYPMPGYNAVCYSRWQLERFVRLYCQNAVGVDLMVNEEVYSFQGDKGERFLFVGKLTPEKGALEAIRMCRKLKAPLDVVGGRLPSDPNIYEAEVRENCDVVVGDLSSEVKEGDIVFYGNIPNWKKIELMKNARALIYPVQQDESHCQTIAEALMCGTPVVTYDRGAFREIVDSGVTGFLATSKRGFLKYMGMVESIEPKECRRFAMKRFSRGRVGRIWYYLFKQVMEGKRW